jgi:NAD-dependent dihydropyrimidine dehydrogenase PreA subunit
LFIEKSTPFAPCEEACPAGIDVPRYIRAILQGNLDQALAVNLEKIPLPSVCGHLCNALCESECHMNIFGKPIAIRALKRLATEKGKLPNIQINYTPTGKKIAVTGSGPSALTTAFFLARKGHDVTIFESAAELGGILRKFGEDVLPSGVLDRDLAFIQAAGVKISTKAKNLSNENFLNKGFNAIYTPDSPDNPNGIRGVFTGGELASLTGSVIGAIAAGRQASIDIDKFLGGNGDIHQSFVTGGEEVVLRIPDLKTDRTETRPDGNLEQTLSAEAAKDECNRCIDCDTPVHIDAGLCTGCGVCEEICAGDVLRISPKTQKAVAKYPKDCWTCYNCELDCPTKAITVSPIIKQRPLAWKAGHLSRRYNR